MKQLTGINKHSVSRCQRLFKTLTTMPLYISLSEVI